MTVTTDDPRAAVDAPGDLLVEATGDVLAELRGALDRLHALDPAAWSDGATTVALSTQLARTEALIARHAAAFAQTDEWAAAGAKSPAAWLAVETRSDIARARARVRRGRKVRRSALVDLAFSAGAIGVDHVDRLTNAAGRSRHTAAAFTRDEAILVGWAATMHYPDFVTALQAWLYRADADGAERRAARQHRRRGFHLSKSLEDTWYANGVFDPISGHIIHNVLSGIERDLFEAEWALAKEQLGRDPLVDELTRTGAQRRADALVEMATRAATTPKNGRRPRPLFTILVGVDTFARTCELASGTFVAPGAAARLLDDADIERIVFDGPERVIAVGHRRAFTGALRRAIEVRDRTCRHPYCNESAQHCEGDHITPWALGGPTTQENGELRCGFHNRQREPSRIRHRRAREPRPSDRDHDHDG